MAYLKPMNAMTIIKLIILSIIVYAILLYWAEYFKELALEKLGLEPNSTGRFIVAVIATIAMVIIFLTFRMNPTDVLGVNTKRLDLD